jgi:hypothetical protein
MSTNKHNLQHNVRYLFAATNIACEYIPFLVTSLNVFIMQQNIIPYVQHIIDECILLYM